MSARYAVWQKGNERGIRCVETEIVIRTATDEEAELLVAQMNRYEDSEQERDAARALATRLAEALIGMIDEFGGTDHHPDDCPESGSCSGCKASSIAGTALAEYDAARKEWEK